MHPDQVTASLLLVMMMIVFLKFTTRLYYLSPGIIKHL
jgi:hypothetical protein